MWADTGIDEEYGGEGFQFKGYHNYVTERCHYSEGGEGFQFKGCHNKNLLCNKICFWLKSNKMKTNKEIAIEILIKNRRGSYEDWINNIVAGRNPCFSGIGNLSLII